MQFYIVGNLNLNPDPNLTLALLTPTLTLSQVVSVLWFCQTIEPVMNKMMFRQKMGVNQKYLLGKV